MLGGDGNTSAEKILPEQPGEVGEGRREYIITPHQGATKATTLVCYSPTQRIHPLMRIQNDAFQPNAERTFSRMAFLNDLASSIFTAEFP